MRNVLKRLAVVACLLALPLAAWALINPNFTPIHLAEQSQQILVVKLKGKEVGDKIELEVVKELKGKADKALVIDLAKGTNKQHTEAAQTQLKAAVGEPMAFFSGEFEQQSAGFLHVGGNWLRLGGGKDGKWEFQAIDDNMPATWAGGTDMLIRCIEYILANRATASVPVVEGTSWRKVTKIGAVKGSACEMQAVDLAGDGKLCLFIASAEGDKLLKGKAGGFDDLTDKVKLSSKSQAAAWADFNADEKVELVSFNKGVLTMYAQGADGAFTAAKCETPKLPEECPGMVALTVGGKPALALGAPVTIVLAWAGDNKFTSGELSLDQKSDRGKPQAPLAEDFNNDGLVDILQPYEKGGVLYLGKAGGFEAGKACAVSSTVGGGKAVVADFDGDAFLDVLLGGAEEVRIYQNDGTGVFEEKLTQSGEVAYKTQPFSSCVGAGDFNNDGRCDLVITYSVNPILLYFNRGFRSFGEAPKLELGFEEIPDFAKGQQGGVFADFDSDGALDLAMVVANGDAWCGYNDLGGEGAMCLKVRAPKQIGPVNVTLWKDKRCLGTTSMRGGMAPAFFGIPDAGKYTVKWRIPGKPEASKEITIEDKPVQIVVE